MKCLTKYYMNKGENIANEAIEWLKHADLNVYLISYTSYVQQHRRTSDTFSK